jgi:hypothetical protein
MKKHSNSGPPKLSFLELEVLLDCVEESLQALKKLHRNAVAFGATEPLYSNIADRVAKIQKAKSDLGALFEAQFAKVSDGYPLEQCSAHKWNSGNDELLSNCAICKNGDCKLSIERKRFA